MSEELSSDQYLSGAIRRKHFVFIHQIGKVGSMSIAKAIEDSGVADEVFHTHNLTDFDNLAKSYRARFTAPYYGVERLAASRRAREILDSVRDTAKIDVITVVRDPIARDISSFFEDLRFLVSEKNRELSSEEICMEELRRLYLDCASHVKLATWFRHDFEPVFQVSALGLPFNPTEGYGIASFGNFRILLLKFEQFAQSLEPALNEFLGTREIKVPRINTSSCKTYGPIMAEFLRIPLPTSFVETLLDCDIVRRCYSDLEQIAMRARYIEKHS